MDLFGQRELAELLAVQDDPPYLSLYLPMERITSASHQNPVRFRNALRRAHEELVRWGASPAQLHHLLAPLEELADREVFWLYQSDGLAVFATATYTCSYRLPWRFREEIYVGDSFVVAPLVPLFLSNRQFLVLALEKYRVRLYGGGPTGLTEVERERLPLDLWKALQVDVPEPLVQYRTGLRLGRGQIMATHGHTFEREDIKRLVAEYYRMVDRALAPLGHERQLPLVVAGVEYLVGIYREISSYPLLLPEALLGSPEQYSLTELHAQASEIVMRWSDAERRRWLERFWQLRGSSPKAAEELTTVLQALYEGRVETLLVRPDAELWGKVDRFTASLQLLPPQTPGAVNLVNEAIIHAFATRVRVYAATAEELPPDTAMVAILRY